MITIVGSLLCSPLPCFCAPSEWVQWDVSSGGNGHWYKPVPGFPGITWTLTNELAQAEGGYLATITSAAENAFVFSLVAVSRSQTFEARLLSKIRFVKDRP